MGGGQNLLIVFEMLIYAICHKFIFSYTDFRAGGPLQTYLDETRAARKELKTAVTPPPSLPVPHPPRAARSSRPRSRTPPSPLPFARPSPPPPRPAPPPPSPCPREPQGAQDRCQAPPVRPRPPRRMVW